MGFYMASSVSCFMVTWTTLENHLLLVSLTQNQETVALQTLTTVDLLCFVMCEQSMNINSMKHHLVEGSVTYDFTLHLRVRGHIT